MWVPWVPWFWTTLDLFQTYNISLPFMKLMESVREGTSHSFESSLQFFWCLCFGVGAELGPGLFKIFSVKDKVFTDGRFQFKFDSFSWVDMSSTIHIVESTNHQLTRGLYEFMKYSSLRRTDNQNVDVAYRFFYQNSVVVSDIIRHVIRGRGFRLTLTSPCGDDMMLSILWLCDMIHMWIFMNVELWMLWVNSDELTIILVGVRVGLNVLLIPLSPPLTIKVCLIEQFKFLHTIRTGENSCRIKAGRGFASAGGPAPAIKRKRARTSDFSRVDPPAACVPPKLEEGRESIVPPIDQEPFVVLDTFVISPRNCN